MLLLSRDLLLKRLTLQECVLTGSALKTGESIFARQAFPQVYCLSAWDKKSLELLRSFVGAFVEHKALLFDVGTGGALRNQAARNLFSLLLSQKDAVPEYCVHAWLYIFWGDIRYENSFLEPAGDVFFTSNSLESSIAPEHRYYKLLQRLKASVNVDLIAISEERQHIFLIEVKRGVLDDRAVGQVLRYFNESNKILAERVARDFNLSYIRPVIVVGSADKAYIDAFPSHFREVLDIFEYGSRADESGVHGVKLSHVRRRYLSALMQ